MKRNKDGSLDRRFRANKRLSNLMVWIRANRSNILGSILLGLLAGVVLGKSLYDSAHPVQTSPEAPQENLGVGTNKPGARKLVGAVEAMETPFCYDPITCIRDVGEELGVINRDIMTMIRIGRCESGLRADAMNKNRNGTFDMGVLQINDVHGKRISRADRLDFEKNIRFGWKLYFEHSKTFGPWYSSKSCWSL